ncbi:MAG: hypothetical protein COB08_011750 [Rhodobacteraceae bacterium]|nr:hypothetical protein [Paracoccaceae bacterium]
MTQKSLGTQPKNAGNPRPLQNGFRFLGQKTSPSYDRAFSNQIATHCLGKKSTAPARCPPEKFGSTLCRWDGDKAVLGRSGSAGKLALDPDGQFYAPIKHGKLNRVAGVINEMKALGHHTPVTLNMHDARSYGTSPDTAVCWPIITYNRRPRAQNLVLWPLPGFHTPGINKYVHQTPIDPFSFDQKLDIAHWRGHLSGPTNTPEARASDVLRKLADPTSAIDNTTILQQLSGNTRFNVVTQFAGSKSVDAAFALKGIHKAAAQHPLIAKHCQKRVNLRWFFKAKYILSLSGTDTGSNFLMAANSYSVVLKEEDGWALFYTTAFQPWQHYIPLLPGAPDIIEKLAWARANPKACQRMSKAARAVCAKLATPENRQHILRAVLEGISLS